METHLGALVIRPQDVRLTGLGFSYTVRNAVHHPRLGFRMVNRPGIPGYATGSAGYGMGFYRVERPSDSRFPRVAGTMPAEVRELYGDPAAALGQFDISAEAAANIPTPVDTSLTTTTYSFPDLPGWVVETPTPMPVEPATTYQPPLGGSTMDPTFFEQLLAQEAAVPGSVDWSPYTLTDAQIAAVRDVGLTTDLATTAPPVTTSDGFSIPWRDIISGIATLTTSATGLIRAVQGPPPVITPTGGRLTPTPQPGVYRNPQTGQTYRIDSNGTPYPVSGAGGAGVSWTGIGVIAALGIGAFMLLGGRRR